jgi:hypothetical protein
LGLARHASTLAPNAARARPAILDWRRPSSVKRLDASSSPPPSASPWRRSQIIAEQATHFAASRAGGIWPG